MARGFLNITGPQVRTVLAAISFHLGIIYIIFSVLKALHIPSIYGYQSSLLPFWVFSLLFLSLGILTFITIKNRLSYKSRCVAAFGMSVYMLYSLTFIPSVALTALAIYPLLSLIYLMEAFARE